MGQSNRSRYTNKRAAAKPASARTYISVTDLNRGTGRPPSPVLKVSAPGGSVFIAVNGQSNGRVDLHCIYKLYTPGLTGGAFVAHGDGYYAERALEDALGWLQFPSAAVAQLQQVAA